MPNALALECTFLGFHVRTSIGKPNPDLPLVRPNTRRCFLLDSDGTLSRSLQQLYTGGSPFTNARQRVPSREMDWLMEVLRPRQNKRLSEFLGGPGKRYSEFLGGPGKRYSEFLGGPGKRYSEFLGGPGKRYSEFLGGPGKRTMEDGAEPHHQPQSVFAEQDAAALKKR